VNDEITVDQGIGFAPTANDSNNARQNRANSKSTPSVRLRAAGTTAVPLAALRTGEPDASITDCTRRD
jgi:hypothetical protein